jgi:serine/threonine-protein kinase
MQKSTIPYRFARVAVLAFSLASTVLSGGAAPTWEWVKTFDTSTFAGYSSTIAPDGFVYVTAPIRSGSVIEGQTAPGDGYFIEKIDPSGTVAWISLFTGKIYSSDLTIDRAGNLVFVVYNDNAVTLAKFGPAGASLWSKQISSVIHGNPPYFQVGHAGVAVDSGNNIVVAVSRGVGAMIAKYSESGNLKWERDLVGNYDDATWGVFAHSILVDAFDNVYASGVAQVPTHFDPYVTDTSNGPYSSSLWVVKYSPLGTVVWLQSGSIDSFSKANSKLLPLPNGNLGLAGWVNPWITFTNFSLAGTGNVGFYSELNPSKGSLTSLVKLENIVPESFAAGPDTSIRFVATLSTQTLQFGTQSLTNRGVTDMIVGAFATNGEAIWAKSAGGIYADYVGSISCDSLGHTYVAGYFTEMASFDTLTAEGSGKINTSTFIAKLTDQPPTAPAITNSPVAQVVYLGNTVSFFAGVSSTLPVHYQWYFNDVAIGGQTNATLIINPVSATNAGFYFVEVSNSSGIVRSTPVPLLERGDTGVRLTTLAGTNIAGYKNAVGIEARFNQPNSPAITFDGNIIIPENGNNLIRIVEPDGLVGTFAGNTNAGFINGPASDALLRGPLAVAVHPSGDIFVADSFNFVIRRISAFGARRVTTFAGSGLAGNRNANGTNAQFNFPNDLVFDSNGNLFVCEFENHTIRKIDSTGNVTTFAGNGSAGSQDGMGVAASFNRPAGIAVDQNDNLFVTESAGQRIRKISPTGNVTTLTGSDQSGFVDGPPFSARLNMPDGIALDPAGNIYFTEVGNHSVRRLDTSGNVTTLAGSGKAGYQDGDRATALLNSPGGIAWYPNGSLIIADSGNHAIRRLEFATNKPPMSATLIVNLHPGLTIFGAVGKTYRIEAAESSPGALDWVSVGTITLTHPVELWFDSEPARRSDRLYRATEVQ